MKATARVWLMFLGVFCAGVIAGGFGSLRLARRAAEPQPPGDLSLRIMERFSDRLELSEAQRESIRPYVERAAGDMHRMRAQAAETMEQLERAIARELTPKQRQTLEELQKEQRERWKRWKQQREQQREQERKQEGASQQENTKPAPLPPAR